jgi:hypothetical protein
MAQLDQRRCHQRKKIVLVPLTPHHFHRLCMHRPLAATLAAAFAATLAAALIDALQDGRMLASSLLLRLPIRALSLPPPSATSLLPHQT